MLRKNLALLAIALFAVACSSRAANQSVTTNESQVKEVKKAESHVVHFDYDSSKLTSDAKETLDEDILPWLKAEPKKTKITVEGHCDERGTDRYNKKLGKRRAEAVKSYLVKNGVKASAIKTETYGETMPVDRGHDEDAWKKNRRAVTISAQ